MSDPIPTVVGEGVLELPGLSIKVLVLSNGERIVPAEDLKAFMEWLTSAPLDDMEPK